MLGGRVVRAIACASLAAVLAAAGQSASWAKESGDITPLRGESMVTAPKLRTARLFPLRMPRARKEAPEVQEIRYRPNAPSHCLPGDLNRVLQRVAVRFGPVTVNSTHRSKAHNKRIGGAKRSLHLECRAIDFRIQGRRKGLYKFLRAQKEVGGLKLYRSGYFHIDNGPRRSW